jgi:predicted phage tail protein
MSGKENELAKFVEEFAPNITQRVDDHDEALKDLREEVNGFKAAFPGGDMDGHCRYHEMIREEFEERRKLRRAIQEKTISGLVWSAIVGAAVIAWTYLKAAIRGTL